MELQDLYRDVILDHNRRPRNFGPLEAADVSVEGFNPLCGDRLTLRLRMDGGKIADIRFDGQGCAISTASASLMTEAVKGLTKAQALGLFDRVHRLLTDDAASPPATWSRFTPAADNMAKVTPAPTASPPGTVFVTALPANSADETANQLAPRVTRRRSAIAHRKLVASATTTSTSHQGRSVVTRGHEDQTRVRAGSAT